MKKSYDGVWWVVGAYVAWGVLPVFWNVLVKVDPLTVLVQRTVWSAFFLGAVLLSQGELVSSLKRMLSAKYLYSTVVSSTLLALNWFSYLWVIQRGELFTASMAYYLCPLMTVAGAALFFGEKLKQAQLLSLVVILGGVSLPLFLNGTFPWMALVIGGTWSSYVIWRRYVGTAPLIGVFYDTFFLTVLLLAYSTLCGNFDLLLPHGESWTLQFLFPLSGIVTAVPMVWLVVGMRTTPLAFVGILQYLTPTLNLCCSLLYFGQTPTSLQVVTLVFVWVGLMVYFSPSLVMTVHKVKQSLSISPPPVA